MRVIILLLVWGWCGAAAMADENYPSSSVVIQRADPTLAKSQAEMGVRLYKLQRFDEALGYFRSSYFNKPDAPLLFDIAQCLRQLGRYDEAARSYKLFIAEGASGPDRQQAQRLALQMDEAAKSAQAAKAAPPPTLVAWPSASGAVLTVDTPPKAQHRPWYKNPTGWSLIGGGVVALVISGVLLSVAAAADQHAQVATSAADFANWHNDDLTYQKGGWPVLGVGAAAVAAGAIVMGVQR